MNTQRRGNDGFSPFSTLRHHYTTRTRSVIFRCYSYQVVAYRCSFTCIKTPDLFCFLDHVKLLLHILSVNDPVHITCPQL